MGKITQMDGFGERLRAERKRLGLSQRALAEIGGVHANAQGNYEKGARSPDAAYLTAISEAGVDVLFVLTGQRSIGESSLAPDERALLDNYRKTSPERRASMDEVGRAMAAMSDGKGKSEQQG